MLYKHRATLTTDLFSHLEVFPNGFIFTHRLQPIHLKYPESLLEVCPDGWRVSASETKPVIGWSSSGWKGFRAVGSEASRPAEHNEVTLAGTQQTHIVQQ